MLAARHGPRAEDLHPVAVRVLDEGDVLHHPVLGPLLESDAVRVEMGHRLVQIGDIERNMAEAGSAAYQLKPAATARFSAGVL